MKILAAIASYGTNNDAYLQQLIDEYSRMPYQVDIVVVSNICKKLPPHVEVIVGLPSKNPWSLPFAHKKVFAERQDLYDLFIYSEDDTLITKRHIEAFLDVTEVLKPDEVAGFLRSEEGPSGEVYYSTVHSHYHWDPKSVCRRGAETFAFFTNEHGACYMLTRDQLRRAIASGGFDVPPHEGRYDMLVSAATDPYTQCGLKKLICISRLVDFTCKHLTNKYIGRTGTKKALVDTQIGALLKIAENNDLVPTPIRVETRLPGTRWTKSYYEPCRKDLLWMIPEDTRGVLSIGCGWGKTEEALVNRNIQVTAIPLDVVIGQIAKAKGIRVVSESVDTGPTRLVGETFDVLLISGLLHLVENPVGLLRSYGQLLSNGGVAIVSCPNVKHLAVQVRRLWGQPGFRGIDEFQRSGIHQTSQGLVDGWFRAAGFCVEQVRFAIEDRWKTYNRFTLGLMKGLWAAEVAIAARKLR